VDDQKLIFDLSEEQAKTWKKEIKLFRSKTVKKPSEYVELALKSFKKTEIEIGNTPNESIKEIREIAWDLYIKDELNFHNQILVHLIKTQKEPAEILSALVSEKLKIDSANSELEKYSELVGEYSGRIMPYIYQLSLSTTNSRRSRSGITFESIMKKIFEFRKIPFEDQASLGKEFYREHRLGKIVDLIVPSKEAYLNNRRETLIVTMKTSLRERWAEVAEEIQRTSIPNIHLLTLDKGLSENLVNVLDNHNITLIVYDQEKKGKFSKFTNVKGFSEFFDYEIPHYLSYSKRS